MFVTLHCHSGYVQHIARTTVDSNAGEIGGSRSGQVNVEQQHCAAAILQGLHQPNCMQQEQALWDHYCLTCLAVCGKHQRAECHVRVCCCSEQWQQPCSSTRQCQSRALLCPRAVCIWWSGDLCCTVADTILRQLCVHTCSAAQILHSGYRFAGCVPGHV